jgi:hypothetical protein
MPASRLDRTPSERTPNQSEARETENGEGARKAKQHVTAHQHETTYMHETISFAREHIAYLIYTVYGMFVD